MIRAAGRILYNKVAEGVMLHMYLPNLNQESDSPRHGYLRSIACLNTK